MPVLQDVLVASRYREVLEGLLRKRLLTWNEGKDLGAAALGRCGEVKEENWRDEGLDREQGEK